jgi:membrane protein implicated in regulation of membrane protease activity
MYKNKKSWAGKIVGIIVCAAAVLALVGYIVMLLWNNVLAQVVNVGLINFWQALGLLILSKLLFSGFGKRRWGGHGGRWGRDWKEKCEERMQHMSDEEREKIKQEWRSRCRVWGKKDEESTIL